MAKPASRPLRLPALAVLILSAFTFGAGARQPPAWEPVPPGEGALHARHENAFVALGERLYLLGGRGQRPLDIYDPASGRWSQGAPPPLEIHHFQALAHEGRLYVLGAFTGDFPEEQPLTHVLVYDPRRRPLEPGCGDPPAPAPRRGRGGLARGQDLPGRRQYPRPHERLRAVAGCLRSGQRALGGAA